jgi:hypothetical protein
MDRFSEETAADLTGNVNRSRYGYEPFAPVEEQKCFYCEREVGEPFLMTGDGELHCSRCFEDFTPTEFLAWLQDTSLLAECAVCGSTQKTAQDDALDLGVKQPVCCEPLRKMA